MDIEEYNNLREYEHMSKSERLNARAKIRMQNPPYHLYFCKSAYKKGGALYESDRDKGN